VHRSGFFFGICSFPRDLAGEKPRRDDHGTMETTTQPVTSSLSMIKHPCRILLIEDDEALAATLEQILVRFGCTVIRANDGNEALARYDASRVDVVVTDLVMPGMEGIELISKLRRSNPSVRIVAMSGGGKSGFSNTYLSIAAKVGADVTISKPFSSDELFAAINSAGA
jgi:two-component system, chemotaxis family, chemotaxis protein CheY